MHEKFGREIRVFETMSLSASSNDAANKGSNSNFTLTVFMP